MRYPKDVKIQVRRLRAKGKTYSEIRKILRIKCSKSTLSYWLQDVSLPTEYAAKITQLNIASLNKARSIGIERNRIRREEFQKEIMSHNTPIASMVHDVHVAKIALAMLCLGEASKYNPKTHTSFALGNSDSRIILLFLKLLRKCFDSFNIEKVRCTVQCRADQDVEKLQKHWMNITKIPKRLFYKPHIDPHTKGKPTRKLDYKGVLRIDYFDRKVQLELESLADLVYNQVQKGP